MSNSNLEPRLFFLSFFLEIHVIHIKLCGESYIHLQQSMIEVVILYIPYLCWINYYFCYFLEVYIHF